MRDRWGEICIGEQGRLFGAFREKQPIREFMSEGSNRNKQIFWKKTVVNKQDYLSYH